MPVSTIDEALLDIRKGKLVILVDDEDRENEGDLCIAAEKATPQVINFMAKHGRGLVCLSLTEERVRQLQLPLMVSDNTSAFKTAFTVSIEAKRGVTTGISAADRATTVLTAISDDAKPEDLARPGHVFPLQAKKGGVLVRTGQTEGSVDLARLAGLKPAGVICEVMNDDGTMARMPDLELFAKKHNLRIVTIADLIRYRLQNESLVHRAAITTLPTIYGGEFQAIAYENEVDRQQHLALVKGDIRSEDAVLVRVHSECLTGDVFGSQRCDCGDQLHTAMRMVAKEGKGVIVYMHQEGRGIGLINKIHAYELQDRGLDTVAANEKLGFEADLRDYRMPAEILKYLGAVRIHLLSNNPEKVQGLQQEGIVVEKRVPLEIPPNTLTRGYLRVKKEKLGHILDGV